MNTPRECVIDTTVLQKANAPLTKAPRVGSQFLKRLQLLQRIQAGALLVLISPKLVAEYRRQIARPRNDFIGAFFAILEGRAIPNWKHRWSGSEREKARRCAYPVEDDHVLRTAIRPQSTTLILTEETQMVDADECIYRHFRVHIANPCE